MSETKVRIQDDLYEAINGEWLKNAVIPEDRPVTGGFSDLDQDVEKIMMADFKAFAEGQKTSDIPEMKYAVALYKKMLDTERRNREGIEPALPILNMLREIRTVDDLNQHAAELLLMNVELPVRLAVDTDMANAEKNSLSSPAPISSCRTRPITATITANSCWRSTRTWPPRYWPIPLTPWPPKKSKASWSGPSITNAIIP